MSSENSSPEQTLFGKVRAAPAAGEGQELLGHLLDGFSYEGIVTSGVCSIHHRDVSHEFTIPVF